MELGKNNKILRSKSQPVKIAPEILEFIKELKETLSNIKIGVGLAAPQTGKNWKIFAVDLQNKEKTGKSDPDKIRVFINAQIQKLSKGKEEMEEGCLSLPGLYGSVGRSTSLIIKYWDENGKRHKEKVEGLLARIIQHEMDHLNGVLFIDKAEEIYKEENPKP